MPPTSSLPIEVWTEEAFDRFLATNFKSPFLLIRDLLPLFSQRSSVILVGSVSAYIGHENTTVYGAAKAGLLSYTRGLTYELKDRGIRLNGLSPGPSKQPVHSQAVSTPPEPARTPLHR